MTAHAAVALALVDDQVDVLLRAGEVVVQALDLGVEGEEPEAAVLLEPRRPAEPEVALVEVLAVAVLVGQAAQLAVPAEGPGVVEALEALGVAAVLPAHPRAAVGAGVVEAAHLAVVAALEDHRPARHVAAHVVAVVLDLGVVGHVEPGAVEDPLLLELVDLLRGHRLAQHLEPAALDVLDHEVVEGGACRQAGHGFPPVSSSTWSGIIASGIRATSTGGDDQTAVGSSSAPGTGSQNVGVSASSSISE